MNIKATPRPAHLKEYTGDLYNDITRQIVRPARAYSWHYRQIKTGRDLRACLRAGDHAWPGGYAVAYLTDDGGLLCPGCVKDNIRTVIDSTRNRLRDGWQVIALWCAAESDEPETCCHCGSEIG